MTRVTIFIPVSREEHLDRLFASLEVLECNKEQTSLMIYVDGDKALFSRSRVLTDASKFASRRCIHRGSGGRVIPFAMMERRRRISDIKNESKDLIDPCTYVFCIEDDTIVPPYALDSLLVAYTAYPYAGFVEGVELGRWGVPYVGAWRADDVYEPSELTSCMPGRGIETIDAGGFYCYLTKYQHYMMAEYKPFGNNDLGPDVEWGLYLRQQGFSNYIDWNVTCEHKQRGGSSVSPLSTEPQQIVLHRFGKTWKQEIMHPTPNSK